VCARREIANNGLPPLTLTVTLTLTLSSPVPPQARYEELKREVAAARGAQRVALKNQVRAQRVP